MVQCFTPTGHISLPERTSRRRRYVHFDRRGGRSPSRGSVRREGVQSARGVLRRRSDRSGDKADGGSGASGVEGLDGGRDRHLSDIGYTYHSLRADPNGRGPLGFHRMSPTITRRGRDRDDIRASVPVHGNAEGGGSATSCSHRTGAAHGHRDPVLRFSRARRNGNPTCSPPGASYPPKTPVFTYAERGRRHDLHAPGNGRHERLHPDYFGLSIRRPGNATKTVGQYELVERVVPNAVGHQGDRQPVWDSRKSGGGAGQGYAHDREAASRGGRPIRRSTERRTTRVPVLDRDLVWGSIDDGSRSFDEGQLEPSARLSRRARHVLRVRHFGNIVTTTSCASDFDGCRPGASGPVGYGGTIHPTGRHHQLLPVGFQHAAGIGGCSEPRLRKWPVPREDDERARTGGVQRLRPDQRRRRPTDRAERHPHLLPI